jgi:homoserine O-succinyltransferase
MSIKLANGLPARRILQDEGIEVIGERNPRRWETRPLRIALLNLMPQKIVTETQIARLLGATPFQIELTLFVPDSYLSKTTPEAHIATFYQRWSQVRTRSFDGLIVTGAPLEHLDFEDVSYWRELTEIFEWSEHQVHRCFYICWAAQAALYHFHGVPKRRLDQKMFGVFGHRAADGTSDLIKGFGQDFAVPVSRHTEVRRENLPRNGGLQVLAESPEAGLCLIEEPARGAVYMFNHLEYDASTLKAEYERDLAAGKAIAPPHNYFPGDDPLRTPKNGWHRHARVLFGNWIAQINRSTPFDRARERTLEWLSVGLKTPRIVGRNGSDLLIVGEDCIDTLPEILRRLAERGLSPQTVRVHQQSDATLFIILRLDLPGDVTAERVSRRLAALPQVKGLAYRTSDGSGGLLVEGLPRTAPAPNVARQTPDRTPDLAVATP